MATNNKNLKFKIMYFEIFEKSILIHYSISAETRTNSNPKEHCTINNKYA